MKTRRTFNMRELTILGTLTMAGLLVAGLPSQAMAKVKRASVKQDKEACVAAYTKGKERANAAALKEARDLFARCAKASCSPFLQQECGHLYTQTDTDMPSLIPVVTDEAGVPRALVEVKMDGALLTTRLDGHALQVDPGKHEFSFSTDDGVFATQRVMILQGQHNIAVKAQIPNRRRSASAGDAKLRQAVFEAPAPAKSSESGETGSTQSTETSASVAQANDDSSETETPSASETVAASSPRHMTKLGYVFGGVGVAGIAGYFLLNTWARKDNDKLSGCGGLCQTSDVNHVQNLYLGANIAGAVGLAAIATSAILYVRSTSSAQETGERQTASSLRRKRKAVSVRMVDVQAGQSGAMATLGGEF